MAGGFAKDGAVQEQIDATIEDAVTRARDRLPKGPSLTNCEECDADIPKARQEAIPGLRLSVNCQAEEDKKDEAFAGYNTSGSNDRQLR